MKRTTVMPVFAVALVTLATSLSVFAADWPQWRGPNRDAKVVGFKAPQNWPQELTQKWKVFVGNGDATPSLVGERLYVFAMEDGNEVIRCLDAATGNEIWQNKYVEQGAEGAARGHAGPRASPTVAEGKVVTLGVRGKLSCLDSETGNLLWRKNDFEGSWPPFFTASSPIVVDGLSIAQVGGGRNNGGIVSYDLTTGDEKWKWSGDTAYASPVLMTLDGEKYIVALTASKIVALGAADGKLAWETAVGGGPGGGGPGGRGPGRGGPGGPGGERRGRGDEPKAEQQGEKGGERTSVQAVQQRGRGDRGGPGGGRGRGGGMGGGGYNASTPVVDGQTVYYGGPSGIKAVKLEKDGDKLIAKELWTNPEASLQFNTPVVKDGLLFGLTGANRFFCVNAENGKTAWIGPGGQAGGRGFGGRGGYGSIVDAGSVLLALTPGSELVVIKPTDAQYNEIARIKVADSPTYAHLVVAGNRLFVKDQDSVTLFTID